MATAVEPFSFALAELSEKYIGEFPQSDIVPKYMETLSDKTGVQIIMGYKTIGVKGSWISLSRARSFLLEFLETFQTAENMQGATTASVNLKVPPDSPKHEGVQTSKNIRSLRSKTSSRTWSKNKAVTAVKGNKKSCKKDRNERNGNGMPNLRSHIEGSSTLTILSADMQETHPDEPDDHSDPDGDEETSHLGSAVDTDTKGFSSTKADQLGASPVTSSSDVHHQDNTRAGPLQVCRTKRKSGVPSKHHIRPTKSSKVKHEHSFLAKYKNKRRSSKRTRVSVTSVVTAKPEERKRKVQKKKPDETEFPCIECDYKASSKAKLNDHTQRMHKGSPTSCGLCGKVFPNQTCMQRHRSSHVAPQHCCDVCGKMFKIEKAMVNHRRTHEEGYTRPTFHCKMCPKTFCSQYIVDCHVKSVHMGQKKSYLCSFCGKRFTTKHSLQEHSNAHTGVKPHVCEICGKGFSYDSALRDHKFTHEQVKQFRCSLCFKSFCQRSGLKMHMRIHKDIKQFQCEECGREFTQKQALQRHERVHKGVKPFICKLCSRSFTDASIIRRHLILVHKIHKDAKTWREDIICTVKPDLEYHVGLVGEKAASGDLIRVRVKHSAQQRGHLKTERSNRRKPQTAIHHPPEILNAQTLTCLVDTDQEKDQMIDGIQQVSSEDMVSHPSEFQGAELLHHTHEPESMPLETAPQSSQPFPDSSHGCSATSESLPLGGKGGCYRLAQEEQDLSTRGITESSAQRPSCSATSISDIPSHPVFQNELLSLQSSPLNYHKSPKVQNYHYFNPNTEDRSEHESVSTTTADASMTSISTTATSTSIAAPQPWSSYYYYSKLASQFGMNFADYSYIASGAPAGMGASSGVAPPSVAMEHPSSIHHRLQALSHSHGHSAAHLSTQDLCLSHSSISQDAYAGSGSPSLQSSSLMMVSGDSRQGNRSAVPLTVGIPSSPSVHRELLGDMSQGPV